ncbi:hypothetical protein [Actinomadura kijaniata]|uniref:hypothetical protein n=1 Tax=Actinomadura kijaniata TaxID=46161 RepID=UPI000AAE7AE0|nr:hypothetical protein [Actinomadura kijaniata]
MTAPLVSNRPSAEAALHLPHDARRVRPWLDSPNGPGALSDPAMAAHLPPPARHG